MSVVASKTIAVLDACVLYPASLRDLLMWLASLGVYQPRLTDQIHAEWIRNVLADNAAVSAAQLERTRRLINQVSPNCLVSGYEALISTVTLPDANDRHVLAAAIKAQAPLIVTYNLSDFPNAVLQAHRVRAVHPDPFLDGLFHEQPELFLRAVQTHRASLHNPPKDAEAYLQTLRTNRLMDFALRLAERQSEI